MQIYPQKNYFGHSLNIFKTEQYKNDVHQTGAQSEMVILIKIPDNQPTSLYILAGKLGKLSVFELSDYLYKTHGPIVKLLGIFGSKPLIFLFDPESVAQVNNIVMS